MKMPPNPTKDRHMHATEGKTTYIHIWYLVYNSTAQAEMNYIYRSKWYYITALLWDMQSFVYIIYIIINNQCMCAHIHII